MVNENTRKVIFETNRVSTLTLEQDHGHKVYTEVNDGFPGSVLGKLAMHMLLDHKAEMGDRLVDRVVLLGRKTSSLATNWIWQEPSSPCCPDRGHVDELHQHRLTDG